MKISVVKVNLNSTENHFSLHFQDSRAGTAEMSPRAETSLSLCDFIIPDRAALRALSIHVLGP